MYTIVNYPVSVTAGDLNNIHQKICIMLRSLLFHISIVVLLSENVLLTITLLHCMKSNYFDYRYRDILDDQDNFLVDIDHHSRTPLHILSHFNTTQTSVYCAVSTGTSDT